MVLLARACAMGYNNVAHMKKDTDLDALCEGLDFQKVLANLDSYFPPPRERAPPSREAK